MSVNKEKRIMGREKKREREREKRKKKGQK